MFAPYVYMFSYFSYFKVTEWQPIGKIADHSAYDVFSWYCDGSYCEADLRRCFRICKNPVSHNAAH